MSTPNVVILLADNVGYNDISIFGAPSAKTPNIDRLGFEGMKLNNFNSVAHLCSASRAAILTGKYPVRTGVYPGVFKPESAFGMLPTERTLADYLKDTGYATSLVGKWHLGHNEEYLPTNQGFDEWLGLPYHASGGSIDGHTCIFDTDETMWLPLYNQTEIIQQPVQMNKLASVYAKQATDFIRKSRDYPFFLFMSFSHAHQLCAPKDFPEQRTCQWGSKGTGNMTFIDAIEEMDWIAGEILNTLDVLGLTNDTFVLFTSDNGPWVAEQSCSGSKGPFEGRWLQENVSPSCTACPHSYIPDPSQIGSHRCILPGTNHALEGVPCGADSGLGSLWEANVRLPALVRWPGRVRPRSEGLHMVSTLDIVPTVLALTEKRQKWDGDGESAVNVLLETRAEASDRVLFFWRDGFVDGPLGPPYGRFELCAIKIGTIKAFLWTKSAHYNDDAAIYHEPPLLFDVIEDPAEAFPLDPAAHWDLVTRIPKLIEEHKKSIKWTFPLTLLRDKHYIPCVNRSTSCRTEGVEWKLTS